jgi:hypothetical protein
MTAATSLLDFILNLLKDPQAQAEFRASPEHVLAANGLTGVSPADVRGTLPLVTDNRYVGLNSGHHLVSLSAAPPSGDSGGARAVIHYLHHITRTYRYDDHGTHAHDPGRGNIWATDGVTHSFDDGHAAAGGPAPGPGGESGAGHWMGGQHENFDLHGFGSGAAMTAVGGTDIPAGSSGDTVGSHDSIGFRHTDSGGAASQAGADDWHAHDANNSLGGSYCGHDSYYGQDTEPGTHDPPEPHIYLDLH